MFDKMRRILVARPVAGLVAVTLVVSTWSCRGASGDGGAPDAASTPRDVAERNEEEVGLDGGGDADGSVRIRRDVELSVTLPLSNELKVPLPSDRESQGEAARIVIENSGRARAKLTGFDLRAPDALLYAGEDLGNPCEYDPKTPVTNAGGGACEEGEYCDVGSRTCHRGEPPEPPLYVGEDSSAYLTFLFAAHAPSERVCPPPPRPGLASRGRRYCGSVTIQTNAGAGEDFQEGEATFHLTIPTE